MNVHAALRQVDRALALNDRQTRRIYNPDPEINSLGEMIVGLTRYGVPSHVVERLMGEVRALFHDNIAEGQAELRAFGVLDSLTEAMETAQARNALAVKSLAKELRGPLAVLADPASHDGISYATAWNRVRYLYDTQPPERLLAKSLRGEIGPKRYALLERLIGHMEATA